MKVGDLIRRSSVPIHSGEISPSVPVMQEQNGNMETTQWSCLTIGAKNVKLYPTVPLEVGKEVNMKIGDLVRVSSKNNDYFGEIGIVTKRLNNFFIHVDDSKR